MTYGKFSKYSIENPEVWAMNQDKYAKKESEIIDKLLKKYSKGVKSVLDVGCGVGSHVYQLEKENPIILQSTI